MNTTFEGYEAIPERLQGGLLRYIEHGIQPGGFLTAVLMNDLVGATRRADPESLEALPLIVQWFQANYPQLYGPENFRKHLDASRS